MKAVLFTDSIQIAASQDKVTAEHRTVIDVLTVVKLLVLLTFGISESGNCQYTPRAMASTDADAFIE